MNKELTAKASTTINVPIAKVWDALVNPKSIKLYMFGTDVVSSWKVGSPIVWKGLWEGKQYEDKGVILKLEPPNSLQYTHFSPLTGLQDVPENYHTLTYQLTEKGLHTVVALNQDNNKSEREKEHSQKMWETMLVGLKEMLEG